MLAWWAWNFLGNPIDLLTQMDGKSTSRETPFVAYAVLTCLNISTLQVQGSRHGCGSRLPGGYPQGDWLLPLTGCLHGVTLTQTNSCSPYVSWLLQGL